MDLRTILPTVGAALFVASSSLSAGEMLVDKKVVQPMEEPCPPDTLTWLSLRSSFTGETDFERGDDASGNASFYRAEVHHRIPIQLFSWPNVECGQWYLRVGADYRRYNFDNEGGLPLPNTLQSATAIIAVEYVVRDEAAFMIEARPGFFFENDLDGDTFDIPVLAYAPLWRHVGDNFSWTLIGGVSYAGHRSYPVIPVLGLVVRAGKWSLLAVPPAPRLMYAVSDRLTLWAEGELAGGSFRTDDHDDDRQGNLKNAVVSYYEYRAGAGLSYRFSNVTLDVGAGYAFERKFDFHRAEEGFESDGGAPFVKVELRAGF